MKTPWNSWWRGTARFSKSLTCNQVSFWTWPKCYFLHPFSDLQSWTKVLGHLYSSNTFQHARNCIRALLALYIPTPFPTPQTVLKPSRHNSFDLSTLYWVGRGEETWICKKTALLFATELVKRIELKLRSDCPKDFCPWL